MTVREIFKSNLKYYRKKNAVTQEQLAELINCNSKYISEIESRNKFPSAETIDAICDALKIKPAQLFDEEGSPENVISFDKHRFSEQIAGELHHNRFLNCAQRLPLTCYAQMHVYNNCYERDSGAWYGQMSSISVRYGAYTVVAEGNYFGGGVANARHRIVRLWRLRKRK